MRRPSNKNNFDELKQSLTDEIKFANTDMDDAKKGLAESAEIKAAADGDLDVTTKALKEDLHALGHLHMERLRTSRLSLNRLELKKQMRYFFRAKSFCVLQKNVLGKFLA